MTKSIPSNILSYLVLHYPYPKSYFERVGYRQSMAMYHRAVKASGTKATKAKSQETTRPLEVRTDEDGILKVKTDSGMWEEYYE